MKYGRNGIERVCADEANRLKQDTIARKIMKDAKWLQLRNEENLFDEDIKVRLSMAY